MPESIDVDVLVIGEGLAGWACVREIARRGRSVALMPAVSSPEIVSRPGRRHRPVGPTPSYVAAAKSYGRAGARSLWEAFREDGDEVGRLAAEVGREPAVERGGGFVLACTRAEAVDLAEGEDLLREDGFSGEFLDHFLLEARFDVRGMVAGYWAVDDLTVDERALTDALRARHGIRRVPGGAPLALDVGARVSVETAAARVRAECVMVTIEDPRTLPGVPMAIAFTDGAWVRAEFPLPSALALPCPARSWDGRVCWERLAEGVSATCGSAETSAPLDWVALDAPRPTRQERGVTAVSRDGLPVIGAWAGRPVFLLHSGSGLDTTCAMAGARWVVDAALEGRDECPALLRALRFDPSSRP